jgi:site-specific recombinase XerD
MAVMQNRCGCVGWLGAWENDELKPSGSDSSELLADLLEGACGRNLSENSVMAYERTWRTFLAWAAAASMDPRALSFPTTPEAYRFLGEGKNAANLKQIRAALSFAYKHWDVKNPFATIAPPIHKEPQISYLLLADIRRLLDYLKARQQGYGSSLAFHLANALFQTACRFDELIQLTWADCQAVGTEIVALRKGNKSVFHDVPVSQRLSAALFEWKDIQEGFKSRRIMAPGGIVFAGSQFVFAGYSGEPFSNRAFNLRLRAACRAIGVGEITAYSLRHSAATILLNHMGKDLREIQELLRHKNIRTTVRYTHVGYEQTRQTAEALSHVLE